MSTRITPSDPVLSKSFGRFIRALRKGHGQSQQTLADRAGVSADTIRRVEKGEFSPSLDTLAKVVFGLRTNFATLFSAFELNEVSGASDLVAIARSLSQAELKIAVRVLATLAELATAAASEADDAE